MRTDVPDEISKPSTPGVDLPGWAHGWPNFSVEVYRKVERVDDFWSKFSINCMQSLDQVLNHSMAKQKTWQTHQQFQRLLDLWPTVVGSAVAQQTCPLGIQRRVLQVATANAAWSQSLTFERHRILEKLRDRVSLDLADIRFSPGQWQTNQRRHQTRQAESDLLIKHPSFIPPAAGTAAAPDLPDDGLNSYQRWATQIQQRSRHCSCCPSCGCPTPPGELLRWSVCGICASRNWQYGGRQ